MELEVFECTFSLVAKMASNDGGVSTSEAKVVEKLISEVLKLDSSERAKAITAFNNAKKSKESFVFYAERYKYLMADKPEMLAWMLDVLVKISYADKKFSNEETIHLREAAKIFGVSIAKYEKYFSQDNLDPHLEKLGCNSNHSFDEITKKYEFLCADYSPEKIIKLGLPKDFVDLAEKKCSEFLDSYQIIKKSVAVETLILGSGFLGRQIKEDLGDSALGVSRSGQGDLNLDLSIAENFAKLPREIINIVFAVSPNDGSVQAYTKAYLEILSLSLKYAGSLNALSKFVFISSTGVYGANDGSWVDENTDPAPVRETSKIILQAEHLLKASELAFSILRFGGIYGPGRDRMLRVAQAGTIDIETCLYSNRIHVEDCSRMVQFVIAESSQRSSYIGVDDLPCDQRDVVCWIREKMKLENSLNLNTSTTLGKRCSNKLIKSKGFEFKYPTYREGYADRV